MVDGADAIYMSGKQRLLRATSSRIIGRNSTIDLGSLHVASRLSGFARDFEESVILIITGGQIEGAQAALELDGVARRIVIAPPDLKVEHLTKVVVDASVDYIVSDDPESFQDIVRIPIFAFESPRPRSQDSSIAWCDTEWVMFTSGTAGAPKMVAHTVSALTDAMKTSSIKAPPRNWATFYDIRRFGGLQIFLRALLGGVDLLLTDREEPLAAFLERLAGADIAAVSGTPSHWRRVLMSGAQKKIAPQYIRLSGEIADQAVLDGLHAAYPEAKIEHAFASTEAGVAFSVDDRLAGFPTKLLNSDGGVVMKVVDDTLRIKSSRLARGYVGPNEPNLFDDEGFVDTGDLVEQRGDRFYFIGRRGGIINVGGHKVNPEEVEATLNAHPAISVSHVRSRQNPLTGSLVIADIVLGDAQHAGEETKADILQFCRHRLDPYKVPATLRFVSSLDLSANGKLSRGHE